MRTFLGNETCRLVLPTLKVWLRVKAWFEGKGYSWVQVKGQAFSCGRVRGGAIEKCKSL